MYFMCMVVCSQHFALYTIHSKHIIMKKQNTNNYPCSALYIISSLYETVTIAMLLSFTLNSLPFNRFVQE